MPAFILEGVLILLSFVAIVLNSPLLALPTLLSMFLLIFVVRWYLRRTTKGYVTEGGTSTSRTRSAVSSETRAPVSDPSLRSWHTGSPEV